jgi:hypothetical protein
VSRDKRVITIKDHSEDCKTSTTIRKADGTYYCNTDLDIGAPISSADGVLQMFPALAKQLRPLLPKLKAFSVRVWP